MSTTKWFSRFLKNSLSPMHGSLAKLCTIFFLSCLAAYSQQTGQVLTGYFTEWGGLSPSSLEANGVASHLTYLNYAFATITQNPSINNNSSLPAPTCGPSASSDAVLRQLQTLKRNHRSLTILLSVGGAGMAAQTKDALGRPYSGAPTYSIAMALSNASQTPQTAAAFAQSCIDSFASYNLFGGVDIDWEFPASAVDKTRFTNLVQAFHDKLGSGGLITAAIGGTSDQYNYIDFATVSTYIKYFNVMTYDFGSEEKTTFNAPLFASSLSNVGTWNGTADGGILGLMSKVSPNQLVLGMPFYGVKYNKLAAGSDNAANYPGPDGLYQTPIQAQDPDNPSADPAISEQIAYSQIVPKLATNTKNCDAGTGSTTCPSNWGSPLASAPTAGAQEVWIHESNGSVTTFDDAGSMAAKVKYAQNAGLAGVMVWELSQDTSDESLLKAIIEDLSPAGSSTSTPPVGTVLYDFEGSTQDWTVDSTSLQLADSDTQHYTGSNSLQVNFISYRQRWIQYTNLYVRPSMTLPAGATVQFRVWIPANPGISAIDAFVQDANWNWGVDDKKTSFPTAGWYTFNAKVPAGGGVEIGLKFSNIMYGSLWWGTIYVDSITLLPSQ